MVGGKKTKRRSEREEEKGQRTSRSSSWRDWASLPREILDLVFKRLWLPDAIRSSTACKHWRQVAAESRDPELSWIWNQRSKEFYSPSEERMYKLNMHKGCCIGLYEDWMIMCLWKALDDNGHFLMKNVVGNIIYNPFSATRIQLPDFASRFYHRIILSSHPKDPRCLAACFRGDAGYVGFFRLASNKSNWTLISGEYADMVFHNHSLYVATRSGELKLVEVRPSRRTPFKVFNVLPPPPLEAAPQEGTKWYRLMESGGELLMVLFFHRSSSLQPNAVFRADIRCRRWETVESLGNRAIFCGDFCFTSMRADKLLGIEDDCIYVPSHSNGLSKFQLSEKKLEENVSNKLWCSFRNPQYWLTPKPWSSKD